MFFITTIITNSNGYVWSFSQRNLNMICVGTLILHSSPSHYNSICTSSSQHLLLLAFQINLYFVKNKANENNLRNVQKETKTDFRFFFSNRSNLTRGSKIYCKQTIFCFALASVSLLLTVTLVEKQQAPHHPSTSRQSCSIQN